MISMIALGSIASSTELVFPDNKDIRISINLINGSGLWNQSGTSLFPHEALDNLRVDTLKNCDTIDTDAFGVMSCGTDDGLGGISADDLFKNANYSEQYALTGFKIANYSTEYDLSGYKFGNLTSDLVALGNVNINTSGSLNVSGNITFPQLASCDTINTDANGLLTCGDDAGGSLNDAAFKNANFTERYDLRVDRFDNENFSVRLVTFMDAFFRILNWTTLYEAEAGTRFDLQNYSVEYADTGFKIGNFTDEYATSGWKILNLTDNLAALGAVNINTSGHLNVSGNITFSQLASCDTINTDANGLLTCGDDADSGASITNSTAWNRTGTTVVLAFVSDLVTIGQTSTTEKLNVDGNTSFEGNIFAGANIIGPGGTGARVVDIGWVDDGNLVRLADDADEVLIRTKLDIGNPGNPGGLDVGEGGSYTQDKDGTTIVQAFTYDASAASGSRFSEVAGLSQSVTWLGDSGDRFYVGSTKLFWAVRFETSRGKNDEPLFMRYYANRNLTNMSYMGILKNNATSVGQNILNQTTEKEYVTWDHEIQEDWNASDNIDDILPDGTSDMFWVAFEVPPGGLSVAPIVDEIRARGTDFDLVSGTSYPVFWGNARVESHERIQLSVSKVPGGISTTNLDIDSAHQQTVFNMDAAGENIPFIWTMPEAIDTSNPIHVELDYVTSAIDTYDLLLTASLLKNATPIGSTIPPDFNQSISITPVAANTIYTGLLIAEDIIIQNLSASDSISFELERTDSTNSFHPLSIIIHYIRFSTGEIVTAD